MVAAFKQGANYTSVWYGEFVIIDTRNKNHKDNGKIYRRGLDFQNSLGGAEYIGQVVGPSSGTPYFQIDDIPSVQEAAKTPANGEDIWKKYPTGKDQNGKYIVKDYTGDGTDLGIFDFNTKNVLVPGKTQQGTYNDSIRYTWVNIREDNADADSWFYVGFQIPYTVIDYGIHSTSPYDDLGNRKDLATIERKDTYEHPFWELWELGIPKGVKGDSLRNLKIITPTASDRIYTIDQVTVSVDSETGNFITTLGTAGYPNQQEDIDNKYQILVYEHIYYDNLQNGESVLIYLGDYKMISAVRLDNEGTLYIDMTHDGTTQFTKKIRWIDLISLTTGVGTKGGHFTFTYNNDTPRRTDEFDVSWIRCLEVDDDGSLIYTFTGTPDYIPEGAVRVSDGVYRVEDFIMWISEVTLDPDTGIFIVKNNRGEEIYRAELDWIKNITLDADGTIHFHHVHNNYDEQHANAIKWVTSVDLNVNTGLFTMNFNYGAPLTRQLDWVDDLYIDEASGEIAVHHVDSVQNTGTAKNGQRAEILDARLKLIVSAQVSEDGVITFVTNTNEEIQIVTSDRGETFHLKYVNDIRMLTGINEDKHIQIKYNTENEYEKIGDPINYIQDMVVRTEDWHLLVLYNDPEHRATADDLNADGKDKNGHTWVSNITGSDGTNYGGIIYWRDMGTIKDQAGVLIGFGLTDDDLNGQKILEYLDENYPFGLTGSANVEGGISVTGKMVTYSKRENDDVEFYAFDYNKYKWYYLGTFQDSGKRDARIINWDASSAQQRQEATESLTMKGVMLRTKTVQVSADAIPSYWKRTYNEWI